VKVWEAAPGLKVYATVVETPGDRLVVLGDPEDTVPARIQRLFNVAHVVSSVIAGEFAEADPRTMAEFREVGQAALALQRAFEAFQRKAQGVLARSAS
jgi:hypothetical protein